MRFSYNMSSHEEVEQTFASSLFTIAASRPAYSIRDIPSMRRLDRANQTSMPAHSPASDQHRLKIGWIIFGRKAPRTCQGHVHIRDDSALRSVSTRKPRSSDEHARGCVFSGSRISSRRRFHGLVSTLVDLFLQLVVIVPWISPSSNPLVRGITRYTEAS